MGRHSLVGFVLLSLFEIVQLGLSEKCIELEKQALLTFKASFLHDPVEEILSSWDPETNCCQWGGIACHNVTSHILKLDLSYHDLEAIGVDPSLLELQHLIYLDLGGNNFNAIPIPIFFSSMERLRYLSLQGANCSGKIPINLGNLTHLQFLDLSRNDFRIYDMNWVSKLQSLQHLNLSEVYLGEAYNLFQLRDNMLVGNISSNLCQLKSLQILDLANNNLSGSIPHCIGNFTRMIEGGTDLQEYIQKFHVMTYVLVGNGRRGVWLDNDFQDMEQVIKGKELKYTSILPLMVNLDLSNNYLIGSIPLELFSLIGLIGLNLSHNHLKGVIPEMIENMKSLESFDISCNQISGAISKSMSKLTLLSHLNMSYNNLSGPIPTENQFLTLNDPSIYVENPYFCGTPLQKCQGNDTHQVPGIKELEDEHDSEKVWFYFVIAIGFAIGFWGVIGTLVLKKSWRYACFRRVEDVADEIYVHTTLKIAKMKRILKNLVHGPSK